MFFSFDWNSTALLCDINVDGKVEVLVRVEFEATRELTGLLDVGVRPQRQKKLLSIAVAGAREGHKQVRLREICLGTDKGRPEMPQ